MAVADTGQSHGKADGGVAVKGSQHLAANTLCDEKDAARNDIAITVTPHFELQNNAALKLFEGGERTDMDIVVQLCVHGFCGSLAAFFAWFHSSSNCGGVRAASASAPPATDSISAKRRRNLALLERRADSGSSLRWRARLTAVNSRSPSSSSAAEEAGSPPA